jgi:hypothetical protein
MKACKSQKPLLRIFRQESQLEAWRTLQIGSCSGRLDVFNSKYFLEQKPERRLVEASHVYELVWQVFSKINLEVFPVRDANDKHAAGPQATQNLFTAVS